MYYNASIAKRKVTIKKLHYGYCQVSTQEHSTRGVALQDQEARIRAHVLARGVELHEVIVDGVYSVK